MEHQEGGEDSGSTRASKGRRRQKQNSTYSPSDTQRTHCGGSSLALGAGEMSPLPQDKDFCRDRDGDDDIAAESGGGGGRAVVHEVVQGGTLRNGPHRRRSDHDRSNRSGGVDASRRRNLAEAIPPDPPIVAVPVDVDEGESETEVHGGTTVEASSPATNSNVRRSSEVHNNTNSYERLMEKYVACRNENENLKQDVHLMIETSSQLTQQHRADVARATKERDALRQELSKEREESKARVATLENKARQDREKYQSLQDKYSRTKYEYHKLKEQQKAMAAQFDEEYEKLRIDNLRLRDALTQQANRNAAANSHKSESIDGDARTVGSRRSTGSAESKIKGSRDWKQEYYYEKKYRELKQEHQNLLQQVGTASGASIAEPSSGASLDGISAAPSYAASQASQTFIPVELQSPSPPPASIGSPSLSSNTPSSNGKDDRNYGKGGFKKHTKTSKWAMLTATASTIAAAKRAAANGQSNQPLYPSSPCVTKSETSYQSTSHLSSHGQDYQGRAASIASHGTSSTPTSESLPSESLPSQGLPSQGLPSVQEHDGDIDATFPRTNSFRQVEPHYRDSSQSHTFPRYSDAQQHQQPQYQSGIPHQRRVQHQPPQTNLPMPRRNDDYNNINNGNSIAYAKSAERYDSGGGRYSGSSGRPTGGRPQYQGGRGGGNGPSDLHESFGTESTFLSSLTSGSATSAGRRNGGGQSVSQRHQYASSRQQQMAKQNSSPSRSSRAPRSRLG